jgi:glycerate kinase
MAWDVAQAIAVGVGDAWPDAEVVSLPLGDGGEGTAGAIGRAVPGAKALRALVAGPLGRTLAAEFVLLPGKTAVVEMAAASGLGLVAVGGRDVMRADTRGTGQLIRAALDALHSAPGGRKPTLIFGVGGSATVDGGLGMLVALGAKVQDSQGQALTDLGGGALQRVASVDLSGLDARLRSTTLVLASDVTNPLLGPDGAAAVFGPQKGASPAQVAQLDAGLANWRQALLSCGGGDIEGFAGAGAAGGVGGVAVAALGASFRPGIEVALELVGFDRWAAQAGLVITGEGRFDRQTLRGKAVMGVAAAAARANVPVCVLAGSIEPGGAELSLPGCAVVLSIADGPLGMDQSHQRAAELLTNAARRATRLFRLGFAAGSGRGDA